jgi:hypothetical protein
MMKLRRRMELKVPWKVAEERAVKEVYRAYFNESYKNKKKCFASPLI